MNATTSEAERPDRETLLAFFAGSREPVSLEVAARLTGQLEAELYADARTDGRLAEPFATGDAALDWDEVAYLTIEAWPRTWLVNTLGAEAAVLPPYLRPVDVSVSLPIYVVVALHQQFESARTTAEARRGLTFHDYVARLLHLAIESETVDELRADSDFNEAYDYPHGGA
ncbi:MAG TPA: hypothetical protein VF618_26150 [Thermoanaerobaculia bacterium]